MSYDTFARYYDELTANIDYNALAEYFDRLISRFGREKGILLDLACGTPVVRLQYLRPLANQERPGVNLALGADAAPVHASSPSMPLMKLRRCAGHGPYRFSAAMCSAVP